MVRNSVSNASVDALISEVSYLQHQIAQVVGGIG
jgi:hypothetical protein